MVHHISNKLKSGNNFAYNKVTMRVTFMRTVSLKESLKLNLILACTSSLFYPPAFELALHSPQIPKQNMRNNSSIVSF